MTIVGFNFTKLSVERSESLKGKINISNNVSVTDVEEANLGLGTAKQKGLKFVFEFSSKYEPNFAEISMKGNVLYLTDNASSVLEDWKAKKKVPQQMMTEVLNTVLNKCNVEALILSKDFNLPPPVPLPKVEQKK